MNRFIRLAFAVAFLCGLSIEASGYSSGALGYSGRPGDSGTCGVCHGGAAGTVTISGPNSATANSTVALTITMSGLPNTAALVGFNAAVSNINAVQPTFQASPGQYLVGGSSQQALHPPTRVASAGPASWTVNLLIPAGAAVGTVYTIYATANAGIGGRQFGWNSAPNHTITIAAALPANPTGLTGQATSTVTTNLTWFGSAPEFKLMRKQGSCPTSPTDAGATAVSTGTAKTIADSGLTASTTYCYRVWGKASGANTFSANFSELSLTTYSPATTRHVNGVAGNDGINTCTSAATPCKTITRAMTVANLGDTISVAPGIYNVASGEVFPINFKSGVQLIASGNPSNTIIDGAGDPIKEGLIKAQSNNSASARIEGFTITNGLNLDDTGGCPTSLGGALFISGGVGTFTITRNVFRANEARGFSANGISGGETGCIAWGGAIAIFSQTVHVTNNVFAQNIVRAGNGLSHPGSPNSGNENGGEAQGGAIYFAGSGSVVNNTFYGNSAIGGNGGTTSGLPGFGGPGTGGALIANGNPAPSVVNNIFVANAATSGSGQSDPFSPSSAGALTLNVGVSPSVTRNLLFGNTLNGAASSGDTPGTLTVNADPLFHAAPGNLHIRQSSPAKGAGTAIGAPATDHDGVGRPNPPAIGAYEGTSIATNTALGSNTNPSNTGQSVTFTATVTSSAGTPTGTVTFKDGSTAICTAVALTAGSAQCATAVLAAGTHSVTAEYSGSTDYLASTSTAVSQSVVNVNPPRMVNLSTRMNVGTGFDVLIGGFVITGGNKTVAVVATGPSLGNFGIANHLANPKLTLVRQSDGATIATNDDWQSGCPGGFACGNPSALTAANLDPSHPLEPAILITLPPGAYTAIVEGVGGGTGVSVVAVYEVDGPTIPLANIATRGKVGTGFDVMIGGFVISGSGPQKVGIVATGPSLGNFGIANHLANPTLRLVRQSDGVVMGTNDDWGAGCPAGFACATPNEVTAAAIAPSNPLEAAILITLNPGAYTAIVEGVGGGTGIAVIGVYRITN